MFEVGFSELVLIMLIALVVLGPEKLPKLAADVGRWVGRARAMARQLRTQLDQEVNVEGMLRDSPAPDLPPPYAPPDRSPPAPATGTAPTALAAVGTATAAGSAAAGSAPLPAGGTAGAPWAPDPTASRNPPAAGPGAPAIGAPTDDAHCHGDAHASSPVAAALPTTSASPIPRMATGTPDNEPLAEGTLISHLLELRTRLMRAALAVAIVAAPCLWFANELFTLVATPLLEALPKGAAMISTSVVAPFMTPFKLAVYVAVFVAMPYVLYQIWAFVAPGLYRHERRFALPLLVSSIVLFYAGVAFAYFVVFPLAFRFFAATAPAGVQMMTDMTQYLDFVLVLFLAFGAAFEMPVAIVLLVWTGLVQPQTLSSNRGYVILGIFVIAAILTPPDAISQTSMALPMYLLYELGLAMAKIVAKSKLEQRARERQEEEAQAQ